MSNETAMALGTFWGWTSGIVALLLLGVLAPVLLGLVVGAIPLARERRDWRPILSMTSLTLVLVVTGSVVLQAVHGRVLHAEFWLVLSLQLGSILFVVAFVQFLKLSLRRVREERQKISQITAVQLDSSDIEREAVEPGPRARMNAIEAEYYIADWMRYLGATEAVVTPARRDGGVDVRSVQFVAQVKHRPNDIVSVMELRELLGVAGLEGRTALFFASGRFSRDAYELASRAGMALFIFRPQEGRLIAANALASRLRQAGLGETTARVDRSSLPHPAGTAQR